MKQKETSENITSLGLNIRVIKKPSGKVYFPEKLAIANEVIAKLKTPLPK